MSAPHFFSHPSRGRGGPGSEPRPDLPAAPPDGAEVDPPSDAELVALPVPPVLQEPTAPSRRGATTRSKLAEGARGIKLAIRAESSYFAHAYRGLLIAISAALLGLSAGGWCLLIVSAALVLVAETFRCALCAALDAVADPADPLAKTAREIAAGGLLFASMTSAAITITVLVSRLGEVLGW
ncbi:diacylglycerol kinase family protein [Tautonia sociabilis]|uniref:Diacylglycerol kinase family protein n=1 Tax=Tautonia sociabilis TaxID=2080755 RepID=A0A432MFL4_9BACT|nr:diacylglycerol kinase family protein [Tautonia sociabilis]RUL84888.1 hypothetical protein TsocGM_19625 [Tautonia sociabilis]